MTTKDLCSVRMRASRAASHLSGAERLVPRDRIEQTVQELVKRAMTRQPGPDEVIVTIDRIGSIQVLNTTALDLLSLTCHDLETCRAIASYLLLSAGVSGPAIEAVFTLLGTGASPAGGNMRGAMLIDAETGARLEPDQSRGVRVSRFDWSDETSGAIDQTLAKLGLTHFRTKEALALATKVAYAPGVIAELCWSDEPDYLAGYVASRKRGYVRLPRLKQHGSIIGGRAFFVRKEHCDVNTLISFLERTPVIITGIGSCNTAENAMLLGAAE